MTTATLSRPKRAKQAGISLSTSSLKAALAAVRAAVPTRSPKPVLLNVLMGGGSLTASDLELQITTPIDYDGEPILLPHAKLTAILGAARGDEVTIEPKGSTCVVTVGSGSWTLPTESAAEFPVWEPTGLQRICTLAGEQLKRAYKAVGYAVDPKSSRYALGGILVEVVRETSAVSFVATDGRRLSQYEIELSSNEDPDSSTTLVPCRAMQSLSELIISSESEVSIDANSNEMVASSNGTVVTARLIDGRFPRWRDVFPKREAVSSSVVPEELLSATRQAAIVTSEQSKGVTFAFANDGIHLTAHSSESGQSSVTCKIGKCGLEATVKLDPHFLIQLLSNVDADAPFSVEVDKPGDAVVFRSDIKEGEIGGFRAVIMPLAND